MTVANIFRHGEKARNGILQMVAHRTPAGMPIREIDNYHLGKKGWAMTSPAAKKHFSKIEAARNGDKNAAAALQSLEKNLVDIRLVEVLLKDGRDKVSDGASFLACHLLAVAPQDSNVQLAELYRILKQLKLGAGEADFAQRVLEQVAFKLELDKKGLDAVFEDTPLAPDTNLAREILGEKPPESTKPPGVLLTFRPKKKE